MIFLAPNTLIFSTKKVHVLSGVGASDNAWPYPLPWQHTASTLTQVVCRDKVVNELQCLNTSTAQSLSYDPLSFVDLLLF